MTATTPFLEGAEKLGAKLQIDTAFPESLIAADPDIKGADPWRAKPRLGAGIGAE